MCLVDEFGLHRILMYKDMEALAELKSTVAKSEHGSIRCYEEIYISKLKPFTKNNKGAMKIMYTEFCNLLNTSIMSGDKQTKKSKDIWKYFTRKYEHQFYNYKTKKYLHFKTLDNFWCNEDKCKDRRIIIKFD
jgi:hypothetical protein